MINAIRRVSNGTIPTATHVCSFYKLSATTSRRTPTTCDVVDDNSSDDDAASDVDRGEVQQSDTPSTSATPPCPLPSTTATCVSWRRWIHALHWCLAATAVSVAHVLNRCITEDSVVLCVEVRFKCCCVCFNCVSRFFRIVCVMCGDFYS